MRLDMFGEESVTMTLTIDELRLVNNALNEICNGVTDLDDDGEFATRVGQTRGAAKAFLADINGVLRRHRAEHPHVP